MTVRPGENEVTIEERKPINFKMGKRRFGAIKNKQVWMKRDTSKKMEIVGRAKSDSFKVMFEGDSRMMKCHTLRSFDIYRYYILIEK